MNNKNKQAHEAVLILLFENIITSEQANKMHEKIDKRITNLGSK